jgi:hypothetical protein
MKLRKEITISKRIGYELCKPLVLSRDWKDGDMIEQRAHGNKQTIILFNLSLNDRLKGTAEFIQEDDIEWLRKNQEALKRLQKRYGEYGKCAVWGTKAYNKFNKGRTYEEDIPKKEAKNVIKSLEEQKKKIKESIGCERREFKAFVSLVEKNPRQAMKRIKSRQKAREKMKEEEIKRINKEMYLVKKRSH